MENFLTRYLRGEVEFEDIHDEITDWNLSKSNLTLHEYLGISPAEYTILLENPKKFERYLYFIRENLDDIDTQPSIQY